MSCYVIERDATHIHHSTYTLLLKCLNVSSQQTSSPRNIEMISISADIRSITTSTLDISEVIVSISDSSGCGVDGLRPIRL